MVSHRRSFGSKPRPNTGGTKFTYNAPVGSDIASDEVINLLKLDNVAFHAGQFRYGGDTPAAVRKALRLDDNVYGRGDLRANGIIGHRHAGHANHLFEPRDR